VQNGDLRVTVASSLELELELELGVDLFPSSVLNLDF